MSLPGQCDMYDMVVIGGGINGVGIARDAAGRGLKVLLCEKNDLAAHTSSASSKLIHGGLRYLEHNEFRLVRESLKEREILLRAAPHIIWPMRIVLPVLKGMRPAWMLRIGLFLYDNLYRRSILEATKRLKLRDAPEGTALKPELTTGFAYSDCWADDARLVALSAADAQARGAQICTRTACTGLTRNAEHWQVELTQTDGDVRQIKSRIIVNAAGPWVDRVAHMAGHFSNSAGVRLVKGSHIVTRRLFSGDHGYIFQSSDGRVIFAMPYENDFTLIGTTDVDYDFAEGEVAISDAEISYLCDAVNDYFVRAIAPEDVVWTYSGVRPLYDDKAASASVATRDYVFDLAGDGKNDAVLLSIYGGKLTTFRKLAEHAMEKLGRFLPDAGDAWTHDAALPGGEFAFEDRAAIISQFERDYAWMDADVIRRMVRSYGTNTREILGNAQSPADLGQHFGGGLYAAELTYLVRHEFAQTAQDILWRRSKLGLHLGAQAEAEIGAWLAENCTRMTTPNHTGDQQ